MLDLEGLSAKITDHAFVAAEQAHTMRVKLGVRFGAEDPHPLECAVRVRIKGSQSLPRQRLLRRGRLQAMRILRRYFEGEDTPPENLFAV